MIEILALFLSLALTSAGIPPCPTEDSSNCHWIESKSVGNGNGYGRWFVDIDGHVFFIYSGR